NDGNAVDFNSAGHRWRIDLVAEKQHSASSAQHSEIGLWALGSKLRTNSPWHLLAECRALNARLSHHADRISRSRGTASGPISRGAALRGQPGARAATDRQG